MQVNSLGVKDLDGDGVWSEAEPWGGTGLIKQHYLCTVARAQLPEQGPLIPATIRQGQRVVHDLPLLLLLLLARSQISIRSYFAEITSVSN